MAIRKACRQCNHHWFWHLNDGRYKCRQCGLRQSFRHVWEVSRLGETTKKKLLEYFVLGLTPQQILFRNLASLEATERFYILIRQTLAQLQGGLPPIDVVEVAENGSVSTFEGVSTSTKVATATKSRAISTRVVAFGLESSDGQICLFPIPPLLLRDLLPQLELPLSQGVLLHGHDHRAYAFLPVKGRNVLFERLKERNGSRSSSHPFEEFWNELNTWLSAREVPAKFLHLHLAEISYRFNHAGNDILPLVSKALKSVYLDQEEEI